MPGWRARSSGWFALGANHFSAASCTRFSPKSRWPSAISAATASAPRVLETAIRVTSPALRPASAAALPIRASTSASEDFAMAFAIGRVMRARQPLPRLWLMTDERQSEGLLGAIARLPDGAGIVFRHYSLPEVARRDLFERVRAAAPGPVLLAGPPGQARAWGADGSHGRGRGEGLRSAPVHDFAQIRAAERSGADLL